MLTSLSSFYNVVGRRDDATTVSGAFFPPDGSWSVTDRSSSESVRKRLESATVRRIEEE
jgi:hypothetical protein